MSIKNFEEIVDKKYEGMTFKELTKAPVSAISGISENGARVLLEIFNIKTISDLANFKFVKWAQAICALADSEI